MARRDPLPQDFFWEATAPLAEHLVSHMMESRSDG
jgi:hypothetical protein